MHILSLLRLPLCIRALEDEDIEKYDEYRYDRGEECGDLRASSE